MINVKQAHDMAQERNRDKWIEHALNEIHNTIEISAKNGLFECRVPINFKGAENLYELSSIIYAIGSLLKDGGFEHYITLENELVIQW